MYGLTVQVEVGRVFEYSIRDVTACHNSFVDGFFMLNLAVFSRTSETAIHAGKHCKSHSRSLLGVLKYYLVRLSKEKYLMFIELIENSLI